MMQLAGARCSPADTLSLSHACRTLAASFLPGQPFCSLSAFIAPPRVASSSFRPRRERGEPQLHLMRGNLPKRPERQAANTQFRRQIGHTYKENCDVFLYSGKIA
jgi:hypothetical protein